MFSIGTTSRPLIFINIVLTDAGFVHQQLDPGKQNITKRICMLVQLKQPGCRNGVGEAGVQDCVTRLCKDIYLLGSMVT